MSTVTLTMHNLTRAAEFRVLTHLVSVAGDLGVTFTLDVEVEPEPEDAATGWPPQEGADG